MAIAAAGEGTAADVIAVRGLTKCYGSRVGVRDVSLDVPAGTVYGFIGPNGAGKTTTIRMLLGFLQPDRGEARVFGADCWRQSHAVKAEVGYVPGDLRLPSWMCGLDALRIVGAARRCDLAAPGRELAERFDLDLAVRVRSMSRGMRQKLGLIMGLAHEPRLLILDEPTSALDPLHQDRLYALLRERAARGHTVFFSSHVLSEVDDLCDRVAIIRDGAIVADSTLDGLRSRVQRAVRIRWAAGRAPGDAAPAALRVVDRSGDTWNGWLVGSAPELLAWLRDRPLVDLTIQQPDLDSLFMGFYRDDPP